MHIDILLITEKGWIPIELKYKTKGGKVKDGDDVYFLANQGAKDIGCYLYLKDIWRIEQIKNELKKTNEISFVEGYTVMLTNDLTYCSKPARDDVVYAAFSLHENAEKTGELKWKNPGEGTARGHENLTLEGKYPIHWKEYKEVGREVEGKYGEFYYTYNKVEG